VDTGRVQVPPGGLPRLIAQGAAVTDRGSGDLERDLMTNEEYAIATVLSCGVLCMACALVGCVVAVLVAVL